MDRRIIIGELGFENITRTRFANAVDAGVSGIQHVGRGEPRGETGPSGQHFIAVKIPFQIEITILRHAAAELGKIFRGVTGVAEQADFIVSHFQFVAVRVKLG
ncbi:MAG: hypothetical protein EBT62_08655 [Opitutaceae bacterium]|nr:hypothetical protein [Opitutaceae bacterium]